MSLLKQQKYVVSLADFGWLVDKMLISMHSKFSIIII